MSELKTLQPANEIKLSTGEILILKPLPFGKLAKALSLVSSIFGSASIGYDALSLEDQSSAGAVIAQVLAQGGEDIYELLGLGLNKPREWFDDLSMEDGINAATAFFELNSDFFLRQVLPALKGSLGKIKALKGMVG